MASHSIGDLKRFAKARIAALESELTALRAFVGTPAPTTRKVSEKSYLAMVANAAKARAAKMANGVRKPMSAETKAKISAARRKQIARDKKR